MLVKPQQFEPLQKCSGNAKEDCGDEGETSNVTVIGNAICNRFFEFSKFTEEANKKGKCNLHDVEGLGVS